MLTINFDNVVDGYFGRFFKKLKLKAFARGVAKPLDNLIATDFAAFKAENDLILQTNTSIASLLNYLETTYPITTSHHFHIIDNYDAKFDVFLTYYAAHTKQLHENIYSYSAIPSGEEIYMTYYAEDIPVYQYTIIVPTAYASSVSAIDAICSMWRPAGRQYQIIIQDI